MLFELPGLLLIDTPGHEAFGNMRERGSSMSDIAIVVIDMFDGICGTSQACINMLQKNNAPFLIAFNKVDAIYEWEPMPGISIEESLSRQVNLFLALFHLAVPPRRQWDTKSLP